MRLLLGLSITLTSITLCSGARILALLPVNSRSHFIVIEPLLLELHKRGHHLRVVSSFPQKEPWQNLTYIDFSSQLPPRINLLSMDIIREKFRNIYEAPSFIISIHLKVCNVVLRNYTVMNLLNGEKFDLIIGEIFAANCFNYYAYKMNVPFISWISSTALPWASDRIGLPDNPSYIPNYFADYSTEMTFFQRTFNTVSLYFLKTLYYYHSELPIWRLAENVFGGKLPSLEEINRQTSLILVNSHFSLSQSRPFPPNIIEVGGIHIGDVHPLPKDIKEFLDSANDGVIFMRFGSLVRVSSLPPQLIRMILDVFASLPQRVILKYEEDDLEVPPNVMYKQWVPQGDIIAHPNVRVLISHGGLASTTKGVHYAKPLIAIPFYADQFKNAWNVIYHGGGILLNFNSLSQSEFSQALKAVLKDSVYTQNMRRLSQQFRDRPMTPLRTAVYWTEYVIRHQGAPHLRPASVNLPLYQYLLIDVIAVLVASLAIALFILYKIIKFTVQCEKLAAITQRVTTKRKNE